MSGTIKSVLVQFSLWLLVFSVKAGTESVPVALKVFKPLSSVWTTFQLTSSLGISGYGLGPLSGMVLVSSIQIIYLGYFPLCDYHSLGIHLHS